MKAKTVPFPVGAIVNYAHPGLGYMVRCEVTAVRVTEHDNVLYRLKRVNTSKTYGAVRHRYLRRVRES